MKNIVLIGDSIRKGYDSYVREQLKDVANVYYPDENCRFAYYVLRHLHDWKNEHGFPDDTDVVHWNAGLWDSLTLFEDGIFTPVEVYKEAIRRVDRRIRILFPKAKVIFATSTRVIEERYLVPQTSCRKNCDTEMLNRAAIEVLKDTDTIINDLYSVTANAPLEWYSDMTHLYTPEGTKLLGNKVLECIGDALGMKCEIKDGKVSVTNEFIGL